MKTNAKIAIGVLAAAVVAIVVVVILIKKEKANSNDNIDDNGGTGNGNSSNGTPNDGIVFPLKYSITKQKGVIELQRALNVKIKNWNDVMPEDKKKKTLDVDGYFGFETEKAVKDWNGGCKTVENREQYNNLLDNSDFD